MIQVQRLTGMRPSEVTSMRQCDIDVSGGVWIYQPADHKNKWRGDTKTVPLGPKAQGILKPFLDRDPSCYMFSPREADAWHREQQQASLPSSKRRTRAYACELKRRGRAKLARRPKPRKRPLRDRYDTASYRRAIEYGFKKALKAGKKFQHWSPNQLRHSRATEVRKTHGLEAAQVVLGHARADVTQIYAEKNLALAKEIARQSG